MLIEFSQLKNLPVFELDNQAKIAELADFFVDEDETKIDAMIVKTAGLFKHLKFIPAKEIVELSKKALIIENSESIVAPKEIVRLEKKFHKRAKIIGERVYSKKGEYLGTVYDYVIEATSLSIIRIYLKKLFDQRIIHSSAIIKIEQKKIIVKDNFEMVRPQAVPAGARAELA